MASPLQYLSCPPRQFCNQLGAALITTRRRRWTYLPCKPFVGTLVPALLFMATPHHYQQNSRDGPSPNTPLEDNVRIQADCRFHQIIKHFQDKDPERPQPVNLFYQYATSQKSKDNA